MARRAYFSPINANHLDPISIVFDSLGSRIPPSGVDIRDEVLQSPTDFMRHISQRCAPKRRYGCICNIPSDCDCDLCRNIRAYERNNRICPGSFLRYVGASCQKTVARVSSGAGGGHQKRLQLLSVWRGSSNEAKKGNGVDSGYDQAARVDSCWGCSSECPYDGCKPKSASTAATAQIISTVKIRIPFQRG